MTDPDAGPDDTSTGDDAPTGEPADPGHSDADSQAQRNAEDESPS